ncbi:hypothetical protein HDU97_006440 [Phlyctochytrium planicorne]|nr:hypothetical protein HDU97_006440 [Phlyctochytrium planicorne]
MTILTCKISILAAAAATALWLASAVNAQPQCLTLPADSACGPNFAGFSVSSPDITTFNAQILNTSNLAGATTAFSSTLASKYSCSASPNFLIEALQDQILYSVTYACIDAFSQASKAGCSQPRPPAMCKDVCQKYSQSLLARLQDCNSGLVQAANATLIAQCNEWDVNNCVARYDAIEAATCGFPTLSLAKEYCHTIANSDEASNTPSCCIQLLQQYPLSPFLLDTTNTAPLHTFSSSYSNIRFNLKTPYSSLCMREKSFGGLLKVSSCYNTHTYGTTQFTYNRRDKSIQSLDSGRCLEKVSYKSSTMNIVYTHPLLRGCDGNPNQRWNITSGVDEGFVNGGVPVYNIQSNLGLCINVGQNTEYGTIAVMGSCKRDTSALTFAGFSNF